jgi:hypothetical protein
MTKYDEKNRMCKIIVQKHIIIITKQNSEVINKAMFWHSSQQQSSMA